MDKSFAPNRCTTLPTDSKERKKYPIFSGVLAYFPDAIAEVARVSWEGNEQHNPGEPLHWARGKSMDQEDTLVRHLMESGGGNVGTGRDSDGQRHAAKVAWRALAKLQLEIEAERVQAVASQPQTTKQEDLDARLERGDADPLYSITAEDVCLRKVLGRHSMAYACSRPKGHPGLHVASGALGVLAVEGKLI